MFVELIESLRCPNAHEDTALVASAGRSEARHIIDGTLGCPTCGAEFPITNGVLVMSQPRGTSGREPASAEEAMRLAAFLELTDARGFALLCGRWASHASAVRALSETPLVLVNPALPAPEDVAAVVLTSAALPFAAGSARAAALDGAMSPDVLASAVNAVRAGGRIVGPVTLALPANVTELTRDARAWVAEKKATPVPAPPLVSLKRAR